MHKLTQFLFFEQWQRVRDACRSRGIVIMGDLPIFVAHDSADVWVHRDLFQLERDGRPSVVAGVPPDYFSATGQLWGNPHYRWDVFERTGYAWWVERCRALLRLVDRVRIDHFRGFEASWQVASDATTAIGGEWVKGPGAAFFDVMRAALGVDRLPFVAENLGVITPEVEALRERFDLPGMAILQFAFGTDPHAPDFQPHNYPRNLVVYTGTHDNDTTVGWWTGEAGHSTRSMTDIENEREHARRYLALDGREVHWEFIRAALASVAETAIIPAQDLLGLGSDARMNRPGTLAGNWRWRLRPGQPSGDVAQRLAVMTATYERR
jgi:4-alpha-glucanotransferase